MSHIDPCDLPRAALKSHIQHIFSTARLWARSSSPQAILALAIYKMGFSHATTQIATGSAPDWHINDIFADCADMLAYIRVEQLKLTRNDFKSTVESRMIRRMGGDALPED